jgi:hypothetical protein
MPCILVFGPTMLSGILHTHFEVSRPILVLLYEHLFDCFLELLEGKTLTAGGHTLEDVRHC